MCDVFCKSLTRLRVWEMSENYVTLASRGNEICLFKKLNSPPRLARRREREKESESHPAPSFVRLVRKGHARCRLNVASVAKCAPRV